MIFASDLINKYNVLELHKNKYVQNNRVLESVGRSEEFV